VISHCVRLYFRFPLSFREVEELMPERGIVVCYESKTFRSGGGAQRFRSAFSRASARTVRRHTPNDVTTPEGGVPTTDDVPPSLINRTTIPSAQPT
jgi:hypothetical protein